MTLYTVVAALLGGTLVLFAAGITIFVGWTRFGIALSAAPSKVGELVPHLGVLLVVQVLNELARHRGQKLSWSLGWNITDQIYMIEGGIVPAIQSIATPSLTVYFSFMYLYGYIFLTGFPLLAYFALEDLRHLKVTVLAYSLNYFLGLVLYTMFISYGPRNLIPDQVDSLLYTAYPGVQLLTSEVNSNTNVFPSLHASLSGTAVLLARRTRSTYPRWYLLTLPLAASIILSTMYLGIHWATDVVAGIALGYACVWLGDRYADLRTVVS